MLSFFVFMVLLLCFYSLWFPFYFGSFQLLSFIFLPSHKTGMGSFVIIKKINYFPTFARFIYSLFLSLSKWFLKIIFFLAFTHNVGNVINKQQTIINYAFLFVNQISISSFVVIQFLVTHDGVPDQKMCGVGKRILGRRGYQDKEELFAARIETTTSFLPFFTLPMFLLKA